MTRGVMRPRNARTRGFRIWELIGYLCVGYPLSDDDKLALMRVGWEKCDPRAATLLVR
jgi:hypothetical protein